MSKTKQQIAKEYEQQLTALRASDMVRGERIKELEAQLVQVTEEAGDAAVALAQLRPQLKQLEIERDLAVARAEALENTRALAAMHEQNTGAIATRLRCVLAAVHQLAEACEPESTKDED